MKTATAILAACVLAASTTLAGQTQGVILEQILVKVNGEIFTKTDLETQQITALRNANRLVVLKDGRIAETGTHDELMEKKGEFQRLVQIQQEMSRIKAVDR